MSQVALVVISTVGWPAAQLALFGLRFQRMPPGGVSDALVFAPMGLVAGIVGAALMRAATSARQRRAVVWGYGAACPFALVGSLLGGLVLPGLWGPLIAGAIPLSIGCLVGFAVGRRRPPAGTQQAHRADGHEVD
jgi:hypothetical protein